MTIRSSFLLLLVAGVVAGCAPTGVGVRYPTERVIQRPASTTSAPAARSAALYRRADSDAQRYVREVDRAVRLSRHQQRELRVLLHERTHHLLDRTRPVDHALVYPFPRRAGERERTVRRFWQDTDRAIERTLSSSPRRAYRDWVRHNERQASNDRRARPAHPHGSPPGRGRGR
jgi:hypothetical protein